MTWPRPVEIASEVARLARSFFGKDTEVIWFGSWPQGKALPHSDIDVAISTGVPIPPEHMGRLQEAVDELPTLYEIDIMDLNATGSRLTRRNPQTRGTPMTARREAFAAAIARLSEVLKAPESDVSRDAAIQRFEFCFELAWKSIQERARDEGLDCQPPKACLRIAFKTSWIENEQGWLAMLEDRTRTSHTYDEDLAKAVFRRLPNYQPLLEALLNKLTP